MTDGPKETLKKFIFTSKINTAGEAQEERLEIIIPEVCYTLLKVECFIVMIVCTFIVLNL